MKIKISTLRSVIKECILQEAQVVDPLAKAIGMALASVMRSEEFKDDVLRMMPKGQALDVQNTATELITKLPQSELFREPIHSLIDALAPEQANKQPLSAPKPLSPEEMQQPKTVRAPAMNQ